MIGLAENKLLESQHCTFVLPSIELYSWVFAVRYVNAIPTLHVVNAIIFLEQLFKLLVAVNLCHHAITCLDMHGVSNQMAR